MKKALLKPCFLLHSFNFQMKQKNEYICLQEVAETFFLQA